MTVRILLHTLSHDTTMIRVVRIERKRSKKYIKSVVLSSRYGLSPK